jgi:UDPglucose 6-dehydrogenase
MESDEVQKEGAQDNHEDQFIDGGVVIQVILPAFEEREFMEIAVVGTGYVGLVAAACFASAGHDVICVDTNPEKLKSLKAGKAPFFEPQLDELLTKSLPRMTFADTARYAVEKVRVIFIAVGTPELPDGSPDLAATYKVLGEICATATAPTTVVMKSTVPIGESKKARAFCEANAKVAIDIVSNPEFLRQGCAVKDFLHPDRVVIGCSTDAPKKTMTTLYKSFVPSEDKILFMDNTSAEMVKYAANSFLAMKISFINELALLAGKLGADIGNVKRGFTSDHRINPAFFNPGIGYGGSCFPKDVHALLHIGKNAGVDLKLLLATDEVNERQKKLFGKALVSRFGSLKNKRIAIWGLSFKPQTDDVRRAPSLAIIEDLVSMGAEVIAYDPVASANALASCAVKFEVAPSSMAAAQNADALLVLTEWEEFSTVDLGSLREVLNSPVVMDGRNIFEPAKMKSLGFEYQGIGR